MAEELRGMVDGKRIYRSPMLKIPEPHFVVFYNGEDEQPAMQEQRLSDMYERHTGELKRRTNELEHRMKEHELELRVKVININPGYNDEFVASCESLSGYMAFVCKVRENIKKDIAIDEAVRAAVDECIMEGIMAEFFKEHREEIAGASIWEFNQELYDQAKYEDGFDDGMEKGVEVGRKEGREEEHILNLIDKVIKKLKKGKHTEEIAEALEESVEEIKKIAGAAQKFAPEYPLDKIYDFLKQMENKQTI